MSNNKTFLFRYNGASKGGKLLAKALNIKMLKTEDSKFTPSPEKTIINWGSGSPFPFPVGATTVLNKPEVVNNATHKLRFLNACQEAGNVEIPRFTTRKAEAEDLLRTTGVLFARTKLQGSGGEGIVEVTDVEQLNNFPDNTLFVEYIKKKHEFRLHLIDGKVVDKQQKKKRNNVEIDAIQWRVRNTKNGFIFARNEIRVPACVTAQAKKAFAASGLDFGAVDVLYNEHYDRAVVLEINTAPGLEGSTLINYVKYFSEKLNLNPETLDDRYDVIELARRYGIELERA